MKVAIIGTGKIGSNLLTKLDGFEVVAFVGRRNVDRGSLYKSSGLQYFIDNPNCCEVVFDCTDAKSAFENENVFKAQDITVIDMTPSNQGYICVPNINCNSIINQRNISMITCGGQLSIPIINYIASICKNINYVEIITQISAESAGMATRLNVDNYIETTESAIIALTCIKHAKVILNVHPNKVNMQTTVIAHFSDISINNDSWIGFVDAMTAYIPGFVVVTPPTINNQTVSVSVSIISEIPGNLEIINCAAVKILKKLEYLKYKNEDKSSYC